jgi:hypothetical protein
MCNGHARPNVLLQKPWNRFCLIRTYDSYYLKSKWKFCQISDKCTHKMTSQNVRCSVVMTTIILSQDSNIPYNVTLWRVRVTTVALEKQEILHILSMFVYVSLVITHSKRMHLVILSSLIFLSLLFFSNIASQMEWFSEKKSNKQNVFFFWNLLILRIILRDTIINMHMPLCKVLLFVLYCTTAWIFSTDFRKILKYQMSEKSVQWEPSCFMRTDRQKDRQTDLTNVKVAFHNFAKAFKTLPELRIIHEEINIFAYGMRHLYCN